MKEEWGESQIRKRMSVLTAVRVETLNTKGIMLEIIKAEMIRVGKK